MLKQKNGGITLIALVVTIIVLLILAGISISAITGDNGVVSQAQEAKIETELSSVEEAYNVYLINSEKTNRDGTDFTKVDFLTKVYIGEDGEYVYAVNDLDKLDLDMDSGKGTIETEISKYEDLNDVYFVDEEGHAAYIINGKLYGSVDVMEELRETAEDFFIFDEETGTITGIVENTTKDPNGIGCYYNDSGKKIVSEEKIVIPEKINGVTVTTIGHGAFARCSNVETIVMPDTITKIYEYAFIGTTGLVNITMSKNLTIIDQYAFCGCSNLRSVIIPSGITYVGRGAFGQCTALSNLTIENGVKDLGFDAFSGCSSLKTVTIPGSVEDIGNAFSDCPNLEEVILLDGITNIENYIFTDLESLISITIPKSVTSISDRAFYGCTNLTSIVLEKGSTLEIPEDKWGATNATVTREQ